MPSPSSSPVALRLDWVRGRLPRGLQVCEAGCDRPWDASPVFGGLAIGYETGDGPAGTVRLRWTADGRRWQALAVPPGFLEHWNGAILSDGSATGAFAWVEPDGKGRLWRTVDRGRTWRKVTGVADWPPALSIEHGAGRFLAVADDPARLFVSDDGWSWAEVVPVPSNLVGDARADDVTIALRGDQVGFTAIVDDYMADPPRSWLTFSVDGRAWTEPRAFGQARCADVLGRAAGFMCLSYADDATDIWVSSDASTWLPLGHLDGIVEALPDGGLLATLWHEVDIGDAAMAFAYSSDGVTWSGHASAPRGDVWWEGPAGRTLFLFGSRVVWSARLPEAASSEARPPAR